MIFTGSCVALVTPFGDEGVNVPVLSELIDFQINGGSDAILVNGTTGEPSTMSERERDDVVAHAVAQIAGRVPLIVGVGGNNTQACADAAARARKEGANAVLAVTPYYNRCTDEGLVIHFERIADAAQIPVIIYNIPSRTNINVTPEILVQLSAHPMVQAVKEASGNISQITETARLTRNNLDIYSGNDDHIVPVLSIGGVGVISVLANIMPGYVHDMVTAYQSGDVTSALNMQLEINGLVHMLFSEVNPIPVKAALARMGFDVGDVRLPLTPLSPANERRLYAEMDVMGLLDSDGGGQL